MSSTVAGSMNGNNIPEALLRQGRVIDKLQDELTALRDQFLDQNDEAQSDEEESSEEEKELPSALFDGIDHIFRCVKCQWEVAEGFCQNVDCGLQHICDIEEEDERERHLHGGINTNNDWLQSDRQIVPRGTTPLLDVADHLSAPGHYCPDDEYKALIARGASRLMCDTFQLRFTDENGIIAWADDVLFKEFSGPGMRSGNSWKICLGRRIVLDQDDLDGSLFIEGLLEEAMLFPARRKGEPGAWKTVCEYCSALEHKGRGLHEHVWVTRPEDERVDMGAEETSEDSIQDHYDNDSDIRDEVTFVGDSAQEALIINEYEGSDVSGDENQELEPIWYRRRFTPAPEGCDSDEDDPTTDGSANEWTSTESSIDSDESDNEMLSGDEEAVPQLKALHL